ncbi:hypothetical protein DICA3_B09274 [Diutina catenulata]
MNNMAQPQGPPRGYPPQFLANMTPQQMQQLKQHPQYSEMMRSYLQRQQQMAQPARAPLVPPAATERAPFAAKPAAPVVPARAPTPSPYPVIPVINPGQFPREVLAGLPKDTWDTPHHWSAQGDSSETTREYESLIAKDNRYVEGYKKNLEDVKGQLDKLHTDSASYNEIKQLRMSAINMSAKGAYNNSIWGEGYQGYGNGVTNAPTKLMLPGKDVTERQICERVRKQPKPAHYVPIRLEFDFERDKFKLRDTFLWNLDEEVMSVESFVQQLIDDYKFISMNNYDQVLAAVKEQIFEYQRIPDKTSGELRVPIKIDIVINDTQLVDQFEWNVLNQSESDPEEFATVMCDEMALPGEFATAIAHLIREQCQMYQRALQNTGYLFDGSAVQEEDIRSRVLPQIRAGDDFYTVLRNSALVGDYTPSLQKLSHQDIDKLDKEIERDSRRKRRHNLNEDHLAAMVGTPSASSRGTSRRVNFHSNRGASSAPDLSDVPKTFRTPAPSSVLPGAVDLGVPGVYDYTEVYVNKTQIRNPDYSPPLAADAVRYHFDHNRGTFMVKLRFRRNR